MKHCVCRGRISRWMGLMWLVIPIAALAFYEETLGIR